MRARFALAGAVSVLAVSGLALPARAAEGTGEFDYVGILSPETVTVINGQSKTVKFDLYNLGDSAVRDVRLTFGSSSEPISADLGFAAPAGCVANICDIGDLKAGQRRSVKFTVKPVAGDSADPAGTIALSTSIGGQTSDRSSIIVLRTDKGGVDLEIDDIADMTLSPGGSADVPVAVRNSGDKDVSALGLVVASPLGVKTALNYRNCEQDAEIGGFVCVFNDTLAAGGVFTLPEDTPLRVSVPKGTAGPYDYPVFVAAVGLTDRFVFDFARRTAGAAGEELTLEPVARRSAREPDAVEDLNEEDNFAEFAVSVPKTLADSAAVGGVFKGAVGDRATAEVGVHNLGPSATVPLSVNAVQYAHVKLPTGVTLTTVDRRCLPGTSIDDVGEPGGELSAVTDLVCVVLESVPDNGRNLFALTAEIREATEYKAGSVQVEGSVQDTKGGNDQAALTVETTGGGQGGGLPITGAPAGLLAAGGATLLAAGLIAYRLARRRRIVVVAE
ncbi:hypothetical protein [Actinoplanes philippinensis]|uniref:hypothetical protein n=1 Tax=Actinoplanes philippinensis TaxID=35752 RepID=UPI00116085F1|nr:hypothetical protein [Actinoplanes philippinensis]